MYMCMINVYHGNLALEGVAAFVHPLHTTGILLHREEIENHSSHLQSIAQILAVHGRHSVASCPKNMRVGVLRG